MNYPVSVSRRHCVGFSACATSLVTATLFLSACSSVKLDPLEQSEIAASVGNAFEAAFEDTPKVVGTLSLDEAIARALKYNLDQRVQRLEEAVALNVWEAGRFDMLPKALAMAGYTTRDRDLIRNSIDSVTGEPSLANPYISSERSSVLSDLGLSWSTLDFSMSYFTARQNGDRVLIAAEHRRRAVHNLTREVTSAYWKMVSSQELIDHVESATTLAEKALADSRALESEGLNAPLDNLRYQRQILENIRLLSNIQKEFSTARIRLANLVNIPLDSEFRVEEPSWIPDIDILDISAKQMEKVALAENAELREHLYLERIAGVETKKVVASLFPNLSFDYSLMHSDDSYLINRSWQEAGARISQNLTGLLSLPKKKQRARAETELAFRKRVALQMAVMAKVHIARLELATSYRQLELADSIWSLDQSIQELSSNKEEAQTASQLTRVASEVSTIVSMMRRYQALAEFNGAVGTLQATLGTQLDLDSTDEMELPELTRSIAQWRSEWQMKVKTL